MQAKSVLFGDRPQAELMSLRSSDINGCGKKKERSVARERHPVPLCRGRRTVQSNSCLGKIPHNAGLKGIRNEHPQGEENVARSSDCKAFTGPGFWGVNLPWASLEFVLWEVSPRRANPQGWHRAEVWRGIQDRRRAAEKKTAPTTESAAVASAKTAELWSCLLLPAHSDAWEG